MAINWDELDGQYNGNGNFKDYAKPGIYTVKCDGVEFKQVGSKGNYIMKFHFAETDNLQFPTADHWLSKANQNWRIYHTRMLYEALGASEANSKKVCELAESKDSFDFAVQAYEKGFSTLLAKKPEIEIEVYQDGKYTRAEFTNRKVAMPHDNADDSTTDTQIDLGDGMDVEVEIDESEIPFN